MWRNTWTGRRFVIQLEVPQIRRLPPGDTVRAFDVSPNHLGFDELDVAHQLGVSHHYWFAATARARSPCRSATPGRPSST